MNTDEYVPSEANMREAYVWLSAGDNEGAREQATEDFNRGLARVRRDAAREALDGLASDVCDDWHRSHHWVTQPIEEYRDTHYPEGTP